MFRGLKIPTKHGAGCFAGGLQSPECYAEMQSRLKAGPGAGALERRPGGLLASGP